MNLIKDLNISIPDDCSSDLHCAVVKELVGSREISFDNAAAVPKLRRTWNQDLKELYSSEVKFKELKESENILQDEPSSLETPKMNSRIVQVIKDDAAKTGALYEVKRSKRKAKNWFNSECQAQRTTYRRKIRKALRENNDEERKSAFKIYKVFCNERNFLPLGDLKPNSKKKLKDPNEY